MTTTSNPHSPLEAAIAERARWLNAMAPDEREGLADVSLREIDLRFASWLDASRHRESESAP